ncbi:hypothetical protein HY357_03445 [Candidatus Roizmanbacteria bacterium]|nr:hypothetical protein [Candidatus Roizmanbacteria bacterium]
MTKKRCLIFLFFLLFFFHGLSILKPVLAEPTPTPSPPYESCQGSWCPLITGANYTCASSYDAWTTNKSQNLWVSDPEVTALGKAGERSRQFLYWTLTHRSIDNHPVLLSVWSLTKNMAYFFLLIVAAIFGLGIIIGQRANFNLKIEVWPLVIKIGTLFLYVTFSASVILLIIQLSDTLMLFFIERLGVKDLFNIFFLSTSDGSVIKDSETAYQTFPGCSNLNVDLLDSVKTSKFMVNITNMTYYLIGVMMVLRKILLWLLLFVSPFLALLMPFVFIRNIGWIWIGVFFQWVFYGPLFALFLGGLATIWNSPSHIPFNFDFSRTNTMEGFIYPTTINILYGGPAQKLGLLNSSNYVDTFAEYIISLLMLWAVTFFPWWLLRIFRDYCCDGIYAMKNILLSMYDQMRGGPSPQPPTPGPTPAVMFTGTALKIPKVIEVPVRVKLETVEDIKRAKTEDIARSLNLSVSRLSDIAHYETNKQHQEAVNKNINYLQNPLKAETPNERQKYMNIRSELFNRAVREDKTARQVLSSLTASRVEQFQRREELIQSISPPVPVTRVVSVKVKIPHDKVAAVTSSLVNAAATSNILLADIAQNTKLQADQVKTILNSLAQNVNNPASQIQFKVTQETGIEKEKVARVVEAFYEAVKKNKEIAKAVAATQNLKEEDVEKIVANQLQIVSEPDKHVEESISIPPSISLDEYEQVKKMWRDQYERGEVPVTTNIQSRQAWVDHDIVFITNTLNKLVSESSELRQEGLDDLGYILPIFLINNLKGDELLVYLKAKLEAAKEVKSAKEKEKEIKEKVEEKKEEEFVEVQKPKKEEKEKEMKMEEELKENPTKEQDSKPKES